MGTTNQLVADIFSFESIRECQKDVKRLNVSEHMCALNIYTIEGSEHQRYILRDHWYSSI